MSNIDCLHKGYAINIVVQKNHCKKLINLKLVFLCVASHIWAVCVFFCFFFIIMAISVCFCPFINTRIFWFMCMGEDDIY